MVVSLYTLVFWLHLIGVFGFLISHGASSWGMLSLRKERQPERVRALLELSRTSLPLTYGFIGMVIVTGLTNVFLGNWWGQLWPWTALGVGFVMSVLMYYLGTQYFNNVRKAVGLPYLEKRKRYPRRDPAPLEELEKQLGSSRAVLLASVGVVGLLVIVWLMVFKPF